MLMLNRKMRRNLLSFDDRQMKVILPDGNETFKFKTFFNQQNWCSGKIPIGKQLKSNCFEMSARVTQGAKRDQLKCS